MAHDDDIRERYDQIMKGEGVLADIGACAFSHVVAIGVERGLLSEQSPVKPPKEINDVVQLFRPRLRRPSSEETVRFDQVGRKLGYPPDDLFSRRCNELPRYYEVLLVHRHKKAHRSAVVSVASLCAFAGAVLAILDLSADEWVDAHSLNDAAKEALRWAIAQDSRENTEGAGRLRDELNQGKGTRPRPGTERTHPIEEQVSVVRDKIQPLVRELMRTLLVEAPGLLDAEDERGLQDKAYCGHLGLKIGNLPLLRRIGLGTEVNGYSRYWRDPYGGFYVCSQWWKQYHHSNARSLLAFVQDVADRHDGQEAEVLRRHEQAFRDYLAGA